MKRANLLTLFGAWLAMMLSASHAANIGPSNQSSPSQGNITGRVQNVVTSQYLNNARVSIQGTDQVTFTDEFGTYHINNVRSGPVVLEVFYTDLDPQQIPIELPAAGTIERNVDLTSVARYGQNTAVVKLDPFLVASNRETDAQAIATNEQRFAPNIKNVVATDSLGDLSGASAGDFLKHLPGLVGEYEGAEIIGISIRGIGSALTAVEIDGAPTVTSGIASGGFNRQVNILPQSINNLTRVEVTKVPTPSNPADALAGSVNMITKTAFERSKAELRFGLNVTANSYDLSLERTPHPYSDNRTLKVIPGYDLDYTLPLGKKFGIVLTALSANRYNPQFTSRKIWNTAGTDTGASLSQPFLQSFLAQLAPRHYERSSYGLKTDWRVTPNSVLTIGGQLMKTSTIIGVIDNVTFSAGTIGTPTPATGVRMTYGPDFTQGATGRGALSLTVTRQKQKLDGRVLDLHYRFDNGKWKVRSSLNYGDSESFLNPGADGAFTTIAGAAAAPVRVSLLDVGEGPATIEAFNNANAPVDIYDPASYRLATARRNIRRFLAITRFGRFDVGRRIEAFSFPATVQVGVLHRTDSRDRNEEDRTWNFASATQSIVPFLNPDFLGHEGVFGLKGLPVVSGQKVWAEFKANPGLLTQTPAQMVAQENIRLTNSEFAREKITAYYLQGDARLFRNRLTILGGVRFEATDVYGQGSLLDPNAVFVRNADGSFARTAQGARIRRPEAGAAGSVQEILLTRKERGYEASRTYDGYYPSLHFTYNVRENFLARLAYARTYGRPDFPEIVPNTTINEADLTAEQLNNPNAIKGSLMVRNTGLKPWTANNYDLSFEYYSDEGGQFSAGVFRKDITDFFGTQVKIATAADLEILGLDPDYVGWNLTTKFNSGDARITGVEFNARQTLRPIGTWGRYFTVFANATKLNLDGNPHGSFESFVPKTANWGLSFTWKRITLMPKWNYRGLNKLIAQPAFGPDAFLYVKARTIVDLNFAYLLTKHLSLRGSVGNIRNDTLTNLVYGSQTPEHAQQSLSGKYGVTFSLGLKGTY